MMDWTDRHCRVFHRALSARAVLYTEMVVADAVIHGPRERLLGFSDVEHSVVLQLGGSDPAKLANAARIGAGYGYDAINLNVGCPSDRVQSGRFGACLMREPERVRDCVAMMRDAADVPVTVKCRLGVDDQDPQTTLPEFIETVTAMDEVQELHSVTGDGSHVLKVRVRNTTGLERLLARLQAVPGVRGTRTSLVLSTHKETTYLPAEPMTLVPTDDG